MYESTCSYVCANAHVYMSVYVRMRTHPCVCLYHVPRVRDPR